jgi:hypothetical protein
MLRATVFGAGCVLLAAAISLLLNGACIPAIFWTLFLGLALTLGLVWERRRYKELVPKPAGPGWIATEERFVDPATGRNVTVWYQPATGRRQYVSEAATPQRPARSPSALS